MCIRPVRGEADGPKEAPICVPKSLGMDNKPLKWNVVPQVCCQRYVLDCWGGHLKVCAGRQGVKVLDVIHPLADSIVCFWSEESLPRGSQMQRVKLARFKNARSWIWDHKSSLENNLGVGKKVAQALGTHGFQAQGRNDKLWVSNRTPESQRYPWNYILGNLSIFCKSNWKEIQWQLLSLI